MFNPDDLEAKIVGRLVLTGMVLAMALMGLCYLAYVVISHITVRWN